MLSEELPMLTLLKLEYTEEYALKKKKMSSIVDASKSYEGSYKMKITCNNWYFYDVY